MEASQRDRTREASGTAEVTRKSIILGCIPTKIGCLAHVVNRIDELLRTPTEAIVKAAVLGDEMELCRLMENFPENVVEALEGDDDNVNMAVENTDGVDVTAPTRIAATTGCLRAVQSLVRSTNYSPRHDEATVTALMAAASNGHADIVYFAANDTDLSGYGFEVQPYHLEDALYCAISGGYTSVVEVLLDSNELECSLDEALEQATARGQQDIIDLISERARDDSEDSDDSNDSDDSDDDEQN